MKRRRGSSSPWQCRERFVINCALCSWEKDANAGRSSESASKRSGGIFDLPQLRDRIVELDELTASDGFWDDQERAQEATRERASLSRRIEIFENLSTGLDDIDVFLEMAAEGEEEGLVEAEARLGELDQVASRLEFERMLSGEHDASNAIVNLNPGAGGLEAQDWAEMLMRMVLRWAERREFDVEFIEELPGEGAGIKSATFVVKGEYAYGYLRAEAGIHRLVRISPFDANARRQTSFAAIFVTPEIDDDIEIEIRDEDLRIDTYRSSGAGGQHVNKTDSAVRLTHLPTGIVVACQNERSQHKNKATAMKVLKSRLYELELEKQREEKEEIAGSKQTIDFGSQIRSYVLHPYRMVKDHRTNHEVGNTDAVLDGDLDSFIEAELLRQAEE